MLTWITVITLVLTFVVGVLSALFKTVRQHDNRRLPQLTGWGWTLLITLLMLCVTSLVLVFVTSKQAEAEAKKAEDAQRELTNQLAELTGANKELRKGNSELQTQTTELQRLAGINLDTLVQNQEEATSRHIQSLNRFSSLIAREENIGRNTAPAVDRISLVLTLAGEQKVVSPFVTRIRKDIPPADLGLTISGRVNPVDELIEQSRRVRLDPQSTLFPNQRNEAEAELYKFLTFVRVGILFFADAPEVQYSKPRVGGFFIIRPSPAFDLVVDAP